MSLFTRNPVSQVIIDALNEFRKNPGIEPLFVFPTEIEKNSWTEWVVKNPESGFSAVNTDQFLAWDQFKAQYVMSPSEVSKTCVPPLLRKYFAQKILGEFQFKKIIDKTKLNEDSIYAFTDWLSKILPSLALWNKHYQNDFKKNSSEDDDENLDLHGIYQRYSELLQEHNFYEPSYADVNFISHNRKIFIFYPVVLQDFSEYYDQLAQSDDVTFVLLPEAKPVEDGDFEKYCVCYPDARKEIRRLALKIREIAKPDKDGKQVDLRRIAVNVPDVDNIRPYIEREFNLYQIPYVVRDGIPYTRNCGGDIFVKIKECIDSGFSADKVRDLLLDGFIPWKTPELNMKLVQASVKLRVIGSSSEEADIWIGSLQGREEYTKELEYYKKIKECVMNFEKADSFGGLKKAWGVFSKELIDESRYEEEQFDITNKILGRIITELSEYIRIENSYNESFGSEKICLNNYLDFWVNELKQKAYNSNDKKYGVSIFSYWATACADFDYQFIINANQKDITVPLKTLAFISDEKKRQLFGLGQGIDSAEIKISEDGSQAFIDLYNAQYRPSEKKVYWSCAKENFSGAAITHTALKEFDVEEIKESKFKNRELYEKALSFNEKLNSLDENDFVKHPEKAEYAKWQKSGFERWKEVRVFDKKDMEISDTLKKRIQSRVYNKENKLKVSASTLNLFYPCPIKWLFQSVIGIEDECYETEIVKANEIGDLYHKTLELIFNQWKMEPEGRVHIFNDEDYEKVRILVDENLELAIKSLNDSELFKSEFSSFVIKKEKEIIIDTISKFLLKICKLDPEDKTSNGNFGGYKIIDTEKSFFQEKAGVLLNGKIDLILGDGTQVNGKPSVVIIDYKTGKAPEKNASALNKNEKIKNFQMMMYYQLLQSQYEIIDGLFYEIHDNFECTSVLAGMKEEVLGNTLLKFEEYLLDYKNRIENLDFTISDEFSDLTFVSDKQDCNKCRYKSSCRRSFVIGKTN